MNFISTHSPIGDITLFQDADAIVALEGGWAGSQQDAPTPLLKEAIRQFHAYFTGALTSFDLPLAPPGSSFQQDICQRIQEIPYGETRTYKDIATQLDTSPRPVGNACSRNPIPIIIPCHRVRGTITLGGYSGPGGIDTKQHLLRLESIALRDLSPR
ncbi:MAG: cysteine methyltransferase [Rhodospirillaceae bacterium]|nr:cysteine methyltransferase [Rhodospirillaceae bacterium]